ncbi:MAG: hypothetical protein LKE25_02065 [Lactobacillus sp.]|jgi:hypothetical protein|nr:hypothetical protein [Lactobacillus sp.]
MIPGRDQMNPLLLLVLLLAISLLVYVACSLVDIVRIYLFKLLRVDKLSVKIGAVFDRWLEKLNDRFTKVLSA